MLELRRLRLLAEFARRGSIAATANALGYTPSAVSQQLSALEREARVPLLDRTARSAELTDAGRRLAERAEEILGLVETAEAELSAHSDKPMGRVVVTAFPTAAVAFAPALAQSLGEHPDLTFVLRQTRPGDGIRQVQDGEVDIALIDDWTGKVPDQAPAALEFFHLRRDPLVLVVPAAPPRSTGTSPRPASLSAGPARRSRTSVICGGRKAARSERSLSYWAAKWSMRVASPGADPLGGSPRNCG